MKCRTVTVTLVGWLTVLECSNLLQYEYRMDIRSVYIKERCKVATVIVLFLLTLLAKSTNGSVGDRHHIYLSCVKSCIVKYGCPRRNDASGWIFSECFSIPLFEQYCDKSDEN
ncbi:unnamed protein product [Onchocerca flexuosa]|uniref:Secreted protein n=1 Tax=Onchocerca flexuosa TaxID=387005 RepID=A0A183HX35_9BILA|nr:unnamed protein product [Onchocerca flexuosa]